MTTTNLKFVFDEVADGVAGKVVDVIDVEVVDTFADEVADDAVVEMLAIYDQLYTQKTSPPFLHSYFDSLRSRS
ncbi:hypothetical protein V6N12_042325 [Hibiscus sabdariffa]|uniref:Uncharacterized protein n=1 Tax=Hibiscus sabdariffa TaxID=183260 RepID=A0ABR2EEF9_9ROSI